MEGTKLESLSKKLLADLYADYTCDEIGEMYGCCAEIVRRRMKEVGIPRRKRGGRVKVVITRAELEAMYQTMTLLEIAQKLGCGETAIWNRIKEWGITNQYGALGHRHRPRTFSQEQRDRMSAAQRARKATGDKNPRWKGGVTLTNYAIRLSPEHQQWKKAALKRAGGRCEGCGVQRGKICECCGTKVSLHVHHIKPFAKHPELRFELSNAEVVCPKCHASRHK